MEHSSNRVFINEDAFAEHFLAPSLYGREGQFVRLRQAVAPVLRGLKPLHVLLVGPSGAGKTAVALRLLKEVSQKGVPASYVNCMEHGSLYAVLDKIIVEHRILNSDRVSTTYKTEQISRFLKGRPFVLILDEVDRILPKARLQMLYSLSNFGKLGIICIASKPTFLQSIDEHVRSRLSPSVIEFQPYEASHLQMIVQQRADLGLAKSCLREDLAKEIALLARGDARAAIQALRRAAVNAGQRNAASINSLDVRSGWQNGTELKHAPALSLLNEHQRMLFRMLQFNGELTSAHLLQQYRAECERLSINTISQRTFWYYLRELEAMGLIEGRRAVGRSSPRIYGVISVVDHKAETM